MEDAIQWIDVQNKPTEGKADVTVGCRRKLTREERTSRKLRLEEWAEDSNKWLHVVSAGVPYADLTHQEVDGTHEYSFEWDVRDYKDKAHGGPVGFWRFVHWNPRTDELVLASDESIVVYMGSADAAPSIQGQGGTKPDRGNKVIGETYVSISYVLRFVYINHREGFERLDNLQTGDLPANNEWIQGSLVANQSGAVVVIEGEKGTDPVTWNWYVDRFETNEQGIRTDPTRLLGEYLSVTAEKGEISEHIQTGRTWIFFLFEDGASGPTIRERVTTLQKIFKRTDTSTEGRRQRIRSVRSLADSFLNTDGSINEHTLFTYNSGGYITKRLQLAGSRRQFVQLVVPVKRRPAGSVAVALTDVMQQYAGSLQESADFIQELEITADDIYAKEDVSDGLAGKSIQEEFWEDNLVQNLHEHFREYPEVAYMLARRNLWDLKRSLEGALESILAQMLVDTYAGVQTPAELPEKKKTEWDRLQKDVEKTDLVYLAALSMALFEYLRLDVAYPRGQDMVQGVLTFYRRHFDTEVRSGSFDWGPWIDYKATQPEQEFGKIAANIALDYFMGVRRAQRSDDDDAYEKYENSFRLKLAPFGIHGEDAGFVIDQLSRLDQRSHSEAGTVIERFYNGTENWDYDAAMKYSMDEAEPSSLREYIGVKMAEQMPKLVDFEIRFDPDEHLDLRNNDSVFRDFPRLTGYVYREYDIRLAPEDYPEGFNEHIYEDKAAPQTRDDLKAIRFGEYVMWRCGEAHEGRDDAIQYYKSFMLLLISAAGGSLLAGVGGMASVFVDLAQGLFDTFVQFAIGKGEAERSYAAAAAGLKSLHEVEKTEAGVYFDAIFNTLEASIGAGVGVYNKARDKDVIDPTVYLSLDSAFAEVVKGRVTGKADEFTEPLYEPPAEQRNRLTAAMRKLVEVARQQGQVEKGVEKVGARVDAAVGAGVETLASENGKDDEAAEPSSPSAEVKTSIKQGLKNMSAKSFLRRLYVEASCKAPDDEYAMAKELEEPLKEISDVLDALHKHR